MRILVLHQNKFDRLGYEQAFDHDQHMVTYAGTAEYLENIPDHIRCERWVWSPERDVADQLRPLMRAQAPFDRLLARHEMLITPAAQLRAEFAIPGLQPDVAERFRDKVAMKSAVAAAGLRIPRFVPATDLPERAPWPGRTIVKPRSGAGSRGVHLCEDFAQARALVEVSLRADPGFAQGYEVEEFIEGSIWQVDGYLREGRAVAVAACEYVGTGLSFETGGPLGAVQRPHPELETWAIQCLRALGADTLTFHLEAIMTDTGPVFLEVAARCGGGYTVATFRGRTGIHLHTLDMASEIGGELATWVIGEPESDDLYGEFTFPGHVYGGAPVTVSVPDGMLTDPIVRRYQLFPEGVPTPTKGTYRPENLPLSGLISSPDADLMQTWIKSLFAAVKVTAQPFLVA